MLLLEAVLPLGITVASTASYFGTLAPKPVEDCTLRLSYQIGKTFYWRNGIIKGVPPDTTPPMGTAPEVKKGRTFLIIRYVTNEVGAKLDYWKKGTGPNQTKQDQVRITTREGKVIDLWIGNPMAKVDGVPVAIDPADSTGTVAPYIKGKGYTMLPLRFVGDNLGATINWIAQSSTAELIFLDADCVKRCCEFDILPAGNPALCAGEQKSIDVAIRNLCQGKSVKFEFTPKSGIIGIDPQSVELPANQTAILRVSVAMPTIMSDWAHFVVGVAADCGTSRDVDIKVAFKSQYCQPDCSWICGCISKVTQKEGFSEIIFAQNCSDWPDAYTDLQSVPDLIMGLTFSAYIEKYGLNSCADICVSDKGEIVAWKARPNRNPCCQDSAFATVELVSCKNSTAVGIDPAGTRWVFDFGEQGCEDVKQGSCYRFDGTESRPVGNATIASRHMKVRSKKEVACIGEVVCASIEAKNCDVTPPMLVARKADGQMLEVRMADTKIRSLDGRFVECQELSESTCLKMTGYMDGETFVALDTQAVPCPCDEGLTIIECGLEGIFEDQSGQLIVKAVQGCDGQLLELVAPKSLPDDMMQYPNLPAYFQTGRFVRLGVENGRIYNWKPGQGCIDCMSSVVCQIIDASDLGNGKGFVLLCRNADGMLTAFQMAKDYVSYGQKISEYKGVAKLQLDLDSIVTGWMKLDGTCCIPDQENVRQSLPSEAVSGLSTEIVLENSAFVPNVLGVTERPSALVSKMQQQPVSWQKMLQMGARWIQPPTGFAQKEIQYTHDICQTSCLRFDLMMICSEETKVYLDKIDPLGYLGSYRGVSHISNLYFSAGKGNHKLYFIQKNTGSPSLMYALSGERSRNCLDCSYQISIVTDPLWLGLCQEQTRKYVVKFKNPSQSARNFMLTPVSVGLIVNPSVIKLSSEQEELVEVTVMMPKKTGESDTASFSILVQPECGITQNWSFEVPFGDCGDCGLFSDNTLIRLPQMCPKDVANMDIKLSNGCSGQQSFKVVTHDLVLSVPKTDQIIKPSESGSFTVSLTMPERGDSKYLIASFWLEIPDGEPICYDVIATYKDDCCCEFDVELLTRFVAEQTMKPGDTFTYDYKVINRCKSRMLRFELIKGENIINMASEVFTVAGDGTQGFQVTVLMPQKKTSPFANFSFAIKCDCGQEKVLSFAVKFSTVNICCDFEIGFTQEIPQPFMLDPGQEYVFLMGVKNNCKETTLTAMIHGMDNIAVIEPSRLLVDPGKVAGFRMKVKMPECKQGTAVSFNFSVSVDGCDEKFYQIPAGCGSQLTNCCKVNLRDDDGELRNITLCPGQTKTFRATLVNMCADKKLSASLSGGENVSVDPPNLELEPSQAKKITITITAPENAVVGSEIVFVIIVTIPGCMTQRFTFKVKVSPCQGEELSCCDFTFVQISQAPECVNPGQVFDVTFEICNRCQQDMEFAIEGAGVIPRNVSIAAGECKQFSLTFKVPSTCQGVYTIALTVRITKPSECTDQIHRLELVIPCCG
jgi:hypothetical protein